MRRLFLIVLMIACSATAAFAEDATTAWRKILKKCAATDVIGSQSVFFGVSNTIGPGSVWRFADDRSIRLLFELSDAFPKPADQAALVKANNVAQCVGTSSSNWNIKLGLPFSTLLTGVPVDISAVLRRAKSVTVSVTGWAIDELKETPWKEAFRTLGPDSAYVKELGEPGRILAENTVKITGLKVVFTFGGQAAVEAQATLKGKTVPVGGNTSVSGTATSGGGSAAPGGTTATANVCSAAPSAPAGSSTSQGAAAASGVASLKAELTSDNQISLCADGPFYLLAAFSKLVGGRPVGMSESAGAPLALVPAAVRPDLVVTSERRK